MIGRYETDAMRAIWNDEARLARMTRVEVAACEAWHARGAINDADIEAIRSRAHHQSAARVREIERETHHDVVAFVRAVAESIGPAGRHVHRGLTSSDVLDTATALALAESIDVIIAATGVLRDAVAAMAREHKHTPCAGRTHGVHAEPTTFGLRLAGWTTELGRSLERLAHARTEAAVGKLSGAVGNFSQTDPDFEAFVLARLGLSAEPIATQVVPRDRHAYVVSTLALLGCAIERFAVEIRSLQRTDLREAEEPFRAGQTGSSAMPHKRNPIISERMCGMARLLRAYAGAALEDVALWHDRDISHSSAERVILPDAFHLSHYMLEKMTGVLSDLRVYPQQMLANMERSGGLLFSQSALGVLLDRGLDRTEAYRLVQHSAMRVWEGEAKDLKSALVADAEVQAVLGDAEAALAPAFDLASYNRHLDALFARAGLEPA